MLAHDYKGPLTSIVGFVDLAMELGEVNDSQRDYLESVKRTALRLSDLATDTLAVSRLERNEIELHPEDVDAIALAEDVAAAFSEERDVRVTARCADARVRGDARRLRQVLHSIVDNAIKYSPSGPPVDVSVERAAQAVLVQVRDRGIGIPPEDVGQIFSRFSRASNARSLRIHGAGLGLYLARQIVELHGGSITVQSVLDSGSTFTVELPIEAARRPQPLRIAVLDKEPESRSFLAHSLREAGLRVRVFAGVPDAIEALSSSAFDRLVVDVDEMPLTAAQIAEIEREQRRTGFGIVALGIGGTNLFARAASLTKPFLIQDLLAATGTMRSQPV
jgi:CheY-like chemotaxis protein/anti-sigma regulatory factor (Ser/Thr protein kinase)